LDRSTRPSEESGRPFDPWRGSRYTTEAPIELPALVAYRAAICRRFAPKTLDRLRAGSPPFTEAAFSLARLEVSNAANSGAGHARQLLLDVQRRFPVSASVSYVSANVNHLAGDCRAAIPFYETTLQLQPLHEDALLGRTMCLSALRRTDEAIAAATHIIELKTDNVSDAYYWLAWNHHLLGQLDPARAAIDHAKALATSRSGPVVETYTLAGIIEEEQHALVEAERDLLRAKVIARPARNCTADWYLGLVRLQDERWLDSAAHFEDAMHCYEGNVADDEMHLRAIQIQQNVDEDFKAQQIAGFEEAIKEDRSQQHASAFNAANQFSHGGNADKAKPLLDFAAEDPALSTLVGQLRNILDGK
jgi:tetratricopeptide (TPR) repeat protein